MHGEARRFGNAIELGKAAAIDRIELSWPTGVKQVLANVKADRVLTVAEKRD